MKITKEPHRLAEATPNVRLLLARITDASDDELPELLDGISEWCWPRGDLHYWSGTLNRFDDILEETVRDYDLRRLQINDFTPKRKLLLVSLLRFSRLLLENCTNRKLYNSFEHLDALLFTSDLDVFEATLRLVLRPAQHFSTQGGARHGRSAFAISPERLATLAVTWAPREHGFELVDLVKPDAQVPAEMLHVRFQFYKRARAADGPAVAGPSRAAETSTSAAEASTPVRPRAGRDGRASAMASTSAAAGLLVSSSAATPAGASSVGQAAQQPSEGMTMIDLGYLGDSTRRPIDVLADAIEQHGIPPEDHFELFQKIRLAMSLRDPGARRQLVTCRLLAMACYAHTTSESTASTQLFLYEPDVVQRLTALVDPDQRVGPDVQSGAFYALDALGRYRGKFNDVLNAVNASINHGILLHCLRDLVDALGRPKAALPDGVLIDALFGFIGFVTSTNVGSNMVVSAGLLPLLIQLLEETRPETYLLQRTVTRAIGLIHSVIYAYQPSFGLFVAAKGIDVFVARIEQEISRDLEVGAVNATLESGTSVEASADSLYGRLSFGRAQLLRSLLKTTLHMMSAPGTADGLRNLIDSTLLLSVKRIMQNRIVFGGQVLAIAVNVMATFVHNEPTSLGIVQEKGLPEAFLDMIDADIEANFDVIAAIPNAVGALCLNQAGIQMLNARPVVPKLFALFTSERHTKVLADRENASLFGSGIDELVRHQPGLKQSVLDCILSTLEAIYAAGEAYELRESDKKRMYKLQTVPPTAPATGDEDMQEAAARAPAAGQPAADAAALSMPVALADIVHDEPDMSLESRDDSSGDNAIVSYIDVMARFLDGLFQTVQHCKDFLKADGLERLLRFYRLACLPYDFVNSMGNDSLVTLIRLIVEVSPQSVLSAILRELRKSMTECTDLWGAGASTLASLLSPGSDEAAEVATKTFRRLVRLNAHSHLLADVGPTFVFAGAKLPLVFLQTVNSAASPTGRELASIAEIGELQRQAAWQNVCLKAVAPPAERRKPRRHGQGARGVAADTPSGANETSETDLQKVQGLQGDKGQPSDGADPGPLTCNSTALRYVAASLPSALTTFLVETTRLFVLRRSSDQSLRRHATTTASAIAGVVTKSLAWRESEQTQNSFAYASAMIGQATSLLYDDRAGAHPSTNTLVLIAFVREGGLDALLALYTRYNEEITRHFDEDGKARETGVQDGLRLGHVFSGLGACLKMLHLLSAQRPLMDPTATAILTSKDDADRRAADFFLPHEFLVRLRLAILPALRQTWDAKWLPNAPFTLNRSVNQTMLQILLGEGEAPAPRRDGAASGNGTANGSNAQPDGVRPISSIQAALAGLTGALGGAPVGGRGHGHAHEFAQPRSRLAVQPDENRTRELTDMGFPRAAARAALTRCNNNLALAADYLLSHPEIVANPGPEVELPPSDNQSEAPSEAAPPAPEPPAPAPADAAASGVPADAPPAAAANADDGDTQMADSAARAGGSDEEDAQDGEASSADAARKAANDAALAQVKDEKERLDKLRKDIGETLAPRIIALADQHEGLVFDAKVAFSIVATDAATTVETINSLLVQLDVPREEAFGEGEKRIAIRLRILALFLNDAVTMKRLHKDSAKAIMLKLGQLAQDYDSRTASDSHPAWLAPTLLVACSVLGLDENPVEATISQEEDAAKLEAAGRAPVLEARQFADESHVLFKLAMHCLEHATSLSRGDLLAVYRLLVILTRRHSVAAEFVRSGGVPALFKPFSTLSTKTVSGCQALVVLVLRQVIEDHATLRASMEQEMRAWLSSARQKVVDTSTLTRHLSNVMLRDPDMFMALAQEHLEMVDLVPTKGQGMLRLKARDETQPGAAEEEDDHQAPPSPTKAGAPAAGPDLDLPMNEAADAKDAANMSAPSAELDTTMNFLLSELLKATREQAATAAKKASEGQTKAPGLALQPLAQAPGSGNVDQPAPPAAEQEQGDEAADRQYFYTCFLMQCLAELLSSYVSAKTCFVNFSRKRLAARDASTPAAKGKATQHLLGFFLSELVPIGFLRSTEHTEMRKLMAQSNWAMSVLVALAADVTVHADLKQVTPELVAVRKLLLDGIAKAIKDASTASEPVEVRYGRLYALADLCYRLLTARPNHNPAAGGARPAEDLALHMAKTMLEKNFVGVLTSALADVDLNLPMVKSLLDRILKPLEHLTKVAIKMGKAERKNAAAGATAAAAARASVAADSVEEYSDEYDSMDEDDESEHSSDDDEGHAREETPDFYRNSALGMHASENFVEQPGSDEDSEGDEMDMDMEYDSDEDGSDMSADEEDEEMEGVVEIIEEDSDDDSEGSEDDSEDDEDDDDDESGSEMDEGSEMGGSHDEWILDAEEGGEDAEDQALDLVTGEDGEEALFADELPGMPRDMRVVGDNLEEFDPEDEEGEEDFDEEGDSFDEHYDHDELAHLELAETANVDPGPEDRFGATWAWARAPVGSAGRGGAGAVPMLAPSLFHGGGGGGVAALPAPRRNMRLLDYEASFMAGAVRARTGAGAADDLASHPLLVDTSRTQSGPRSGHDRGHAHDWSHHTGHWAHSLEQLVASANHGEGAEMQALMNLLSSHGPRDVGPEGVQISLAHNGQGQPVITMAGGVRADSPDMATSRAGGPSSRPTDGSAPAAARVDPVAAVQEFSPMPTSTRWSESARIVHGPAVVERAARLRPHTVNALLPGLRRSQADAKAKQDAQHEESARLEEVLAQRAKAAEKEELERETAAQQAAEQGAAAEQDAASDADAEERELEAEAIALSQRQLSEDIEMADEAGDDTGDSSQQPNLELDSLQRSLGELDRSVVGTEEADRTAAPAGEQSGAAAGASEEPAPAAPARVTTTVHGREVDITDTGIDPEFLEALPDDMREEVLNQHFRERQASSTVAAADSNIAPEFLNALPPELRAEVIQQEAAEARRQQAGASERGSEARQAETARLAREDDAAFSAFTGMLDRLRRRGPANDNEMLEGLPGSVVDDVLARRQQRHGQDGRGANGRRGAGAAGAFPGGDAAAPPKPRDAIQVLDKAGVATLVRLLFFPQMNSRATGLHKVLANLQENAKTRAELLNLLLLVLADGTSDTNAVDKSYASMTARASKGSMLANAAVTPSRPTPRRHNSTPGGLQLGTPAAPSMAPISRTGDEAPFLIASRTIDALLHLTAHNEQAALYFLRDDARASKKLKGKERGSSAPVNALLALLAKPAILSNAQLVESLIALLKTVTEPLNGLAATQKRAVESAATEGAQPGEAAPEGAAQTGETAPATTTAAEAGPSDAPAAAADSETGALTTAPAIPAERIAAVVRPLATAISAKGFQHTLAVASNLTTIPGGRETVSDALRREADSAGRTLVAELDALLATLPEPPKLADDEEEAKAQASADGAHARIQSPALTAMASPASAQTVLLRSLRALDWVVTRPHPGAASLGL